MQFVTGLPLRYVQSFRTEKEGFRDLPKHFCVDYRELGEVIVNMAVFNGFVMESEADFCLDWGEQFCEVGYGADHPGQVLIC